MFPLLLFFLAASSGLPQKFAAIATEAQGRVGVSAMLIETGESLQFQGGDRYPMQSVYKFPIAMAVLRNVDRGLLRLDQEIPVAKSDLVPRGLHSPIRDEHPEGVSLTVRELLRFAVSESDGTASDVLLRLAGGGAKVTEYLRGLGIHGVAPLLPSRAIEFGDLVHGEPEVHRSQHSICLFGGAHSDDRRGHCGMPQRPGDGRFPGRLSVALADRAHPIC
jgi:beta-lactamase class A